MLNTFELPLNCQETKMRPDLSCKKYGHLIFKRFSERFKLLEARLDLIREYFQGVLSWS